MGLDMYLTAEKPIFKVWGNEQPTQEQKDMEYIEKSLFKDIQNKGFKLNRTIRLDIMYWRKANAIHAFFVDNCADGVDDCEKMYVEQENLVKLKDLCEQVLKDNSLASKLLPSQSGLFFGLTDYDENYFQDIQDTFDVLQKAITLEDVDFYYRASW